MAKTMPMPTCPTCGEAADQDKVSGPHREWGKYGALMAYYLCPNEHLWQIRWVPPVSPVDGAA